MAPVRFWRIHNTFGGKAGGDIEERANEGLPPRTGGFANVRLRAG